MADGSNLLEWLRSLTPEGAAGFEGLVRLLLEAWTGRRFRLARGGEQFGHDAKTDPGPLAPTILVECKRYGEYSKPPSRELMGELGQALARFPALDLWVLAATTEIGSNAVAELQSLADQHAVEILVIDSRPGGGDLEVLCAAYPEVVASFGFSGSKALRIQSDFTSRADALRDRLSGLLLGFEGAKWRMAAWMRRHVAERAAAKVAFGQDLALRERDITLIPRRNVFAAVDTWWQDDPSQPFSLVGEEGSGKSWAAMAWLLEMIEQPDCPLVIPITSNRVQGPDKPAPARLAAEILAECVGPEVGRPALDWWLRRTMLWWQQVVLPDKPLLLFLLDGLNEAPGVAWRQFIGQTRIAENSKHNAVLLTCRMPFWTEHLQRAGLGSPYVTEGYDDHELRQAVGNRVDLTRLPEGLRDLMRRPRYCDLVVRHCGAMIASGDFTIARLIFEDRLDRHRRKERHPFSPQEFDQVLARLAGEHWRQWKGGQAGARFGKRELRDVLPQDDARALQELLDGGVLEHLDDPAYPYRVEKRRLVYGLGMLLASDLRQRSSGFVDAIREWFEPQRDMDIKTEILGAAVFFSLPTEFDYPAPQRRALLREWLLSRNMPAEQEAAIAAYLPDCAEDLLAESDGFFKTPTEDPIGNASGRLGKALAMRRNDARVVPALRCAAERWAGYVRDSKGGSERKAPATGLGSFEKIPFEDMRCTGLQVFLPSILQVGPREGFAKAYMRAALAAGFIQEHFIDERILWSLRLTDEDVETWTSPHWDAMADAGGTGHVLLRDALGTQAARDCDGWRRYEKPDFSESEFIDGGIDDHLADLASRPGALGKEWEAKLKQALGDLNQDDYFPSLHHTVTNDDFDRLAPVAAAVAPDALGQFLRSLLTSLPKRQDENLLIVCRHLPPMMAVAMPGEVAAIQSVCERMALLEGRGPWASEGLAFLALAMTLPTEEATDAFLGRPTEAFDVQQLHNWFRPQSRDLVQAVHVGLTTEVDSRRLARLLFVAACAPQTLTEKQRIVVARCLVADDNYLRYSASLYVLNSGDVDLVAAIVANDRPLIGVDLNVADRLQAHILVHHGKDISLSELVRRLPLPDLAAAVAARGNEPTEVDALAGHIDEVLSDLRMGAPTATERDKLKAFVRTSVLAGVEIDSFSERQGFSRKLPLDSPDNIKQAQRMLSGEEIEDVDAVGTRLQSLKADGKQLNEARFSIPALRSIWKRTPDRVTAWAEEAIGSPRLRLLGSSFFQSLAAALVHDDPALGFRLWRSLRDEGVSLTFRLSPAGTDWMTCLPFQAPGSAEALAVRKHLLDHAITDLEFLEIANAATACGRRDWLMAEIERHISLKPLWRRGKGLTLAALADLAEAAFEDLVVRADVTDTWIGDAVPILREYRNRNHWAKHWYRQFLTVTDRDVSYAGFLLFLRCADRRCRLWMEAMEAECCSEDWRVRYRKTIDDTVTRAINENEKRYRDHLMGLEFKKAEVIPYGLWLAPDIQIAAPQPDDDG